MKESTQEEKKDLYEKWDAKEILSQSLLRTNFYVHEMQQGEILSWTLVSGETAYCIVEAGSTLGKITTTTNLAIPQEFQIIIEADSMKEALNLFAQKENKYYSKITEDIKNYKKGILCIRTNPTKLEEDLYMEQISILVIV